MNASTCRRACTQPGKHRPETNVCADCDCHNGPPGAIPCTVTGGCYQHHTHDEECPGCLPTPTDDGKEVCRRCVRRAEEALGRLKPTRDNDREPVPLADLWAWLGDVRRAQTYGGHTTTSSGDPEACPDCDNGRPCERQHRGEQLVLDDQAREARQKIYTTLTRWARTLRTDPRYQITWPGAAAFMTAVAAGSRQLTAHHRTQADQAGNWLALAAHPKADDTPPDARETDRARAELKAHTAAANRIQEDRETGRDIIVALAEHVGRQLDRLLADPVHAVDLVNDLTTAAGQARRLLPGSSARTVRILCSCGDRVRVDATEIMECRTCGTWGLLSWWIEHNPAMATTEQRNVYDLTDWLLVRHGVDVGPSGPAWLRQAAVRWPDELPRRGADRRGRTLFDCAEALALVKRRHPACRATQGAKHRTA